MIFPRNDICVVRLSAFLITDVKRFHVLRLFRRRLMAAPLACLIIFALLSTYIDGGKLRMIDAQRFCCVLFYKNFTSFFFPSRLMLLIFETSTDNSR